MTWTTLVSARTDASSIPATDALGREPQPDRQRHGLLVVHDERRQRGAGGELVAAVDAPVRVDRIAQFAQPVDVAPQRAGRHAEPVGQLAARPVPMGLQQGEQPQRS